MNKGFKTVAIVAAICIAVGVFFAVIGFALGGFRSVHVGADGFYVGNSGSSSIEALTPSGDDIKNYKNIDIDVDAFQVILKEGDKFSIEGSYSFAYGEPSISLEGDTLVITEKSFRQQGFWNRLLNSNILGFWRDHELLLEIRYPKGTSFEVVDVDCAAASIRIDGITAKELNLSADAGEVNAANVNTDTLDIDIDAGDCSLNNVKVDNAFFSLDAGGLHAKEFVSNGLDGDLNLGSADISGTLRGVTTLDVDAGEVKLITSLPESDYGLNLDVELGDVVINGRDHSGSALYNAGEGRPHTINANVDMGTVKIEFAKN